MESLVRTKEQCVLQNHPAMKPTTICLLLVCLGVLILVVSVLGLRNEWLLPKPFSAPAKPNTVSREVNTVSGATGAGPNGLFWNRTNDTLIVHTNHEFFTLPPAQYDEWLRNRAIAGFRSRLAHAQQLRDLAVFPHEEELLTLWDLPAPERERVLQTRREMVEQAMLRLSEASAEEASAWAELRALGIKEPEEP